MCRLFFTTGFLLVSLFAIATTKSDPPDEEKRTLLIERTSEKIKVDGELSEAVWEKAEKASNFWMSFPVDDQRAERQTEVSLTYDDGFLYVGVTCYSEYEYIIQTLKRDVDFWSGDGFAIVLDPVNKRTNGFVFGVNPAGVQMETLVSGYTGNRGGRPRGMNPNWDNKWYAEVKIYEDRWTAEIAIPFKILRYEENKDQWGLNFIRSDTKSNSYHTWSRVPLQFRSLDLGFTGLLNWDQPPKKTKSNITLVPFTTTSISHDFEGNEDRKTKLDAGLDAKIAVSSSLNLDVTVNPDFSQVEVDQQVTNLTRFNIRLPERRTFFLENNDVFEDFGRGSARPFFSRRIGLDEDGNTIPILYGLRLTGNLTNNLRIGLMNIQTQTTDDAIGQNYTAFAFNRQVLKRSVIKGYFLNRQGVDGAEVQYADYGRNTGLEFNYLSGNGKMRAWVGYNHSFKPNIKDAGLFKTGFWYNGKNFNVLYSASSQGANYFLDMGFLQRVENYDAVRDTTIRLGYNYHIFSMTKQIFPKKKSKILFHRFNIRNSLYLGTDWEFNESQTSFSYGMNFAGRSELRVEFRNRNLKLLFPFSFTDDELYEPLPATKYNFNTVELSYKSDERKQFVYEAGLFYGGFFNGTRRTLRMEVNYRQQPWGNFGMRASFNKLEFPDPYGEEDIILIGPRIEIGFNRNLFWTTFLQWNTQSDNFNINSRFQWRFQPMSDLFIVYTDNYYAEDFGPKNRALVLKLNYWLML